MDYYEHIPGESVTQVVHNALDSVIRDLVCDCNAMIIGEAIRSALNTQCTKRYDIICEDEDSLSKFCKDFNNIVSSYSFKDTPCSKSYVCFSRPTISIFKRFFHNDDIEYVISTLSGFTINGCIYYQGYLYTHPQFFEHSRYKKLVLIESSRYPIPLMMNLPQYLNEGYSISQSELFKLSMKVNEVSFNYSSTVLNNSVGVGIDISDKVKYSRKCISDEFLSLKYSED